MTDSDLPDRCRTAPDLYPALQEAMTLVLGHRLFTLMAIDHDRGEAARIHTSHAAGCPVCGRKPLGRMTGWEEVVIDRQQPWIGRTKKDIRSAFFDHAPIVEPGCASSLNQPVVDEDATCGPRVIGTMNPLHDADWYGDDAPARAAPFAALLLHPCRDWRASPVDSGASGA